MKLWIARNILNRTTIAISNNKSHIDKIVEIYGPKVCEAREYNTRTSFPIIPEDKKVFWCKYDEEFRSYDIKEAIDLGFFITINRLYIDRNYNNDTYYNYEALIIADDESSATIKLDKMIKKWKRTGSKDDIGTLNINDLSL